MHSRGYNPATFSYPTQLRAYKLYFNSAIIFNDKNSIPHRNSNKHFVRLHLHTFSTVLKSKKLPVFIKELEYKESQETKLESGLHGLRQIVNNGTRQNFIKVQNNIGNNHSSFI